MYVGECVCVFICQCVSVMHTSTQDDSLTCDLELLWRKKKHTHNTRYVFKRLVTGSLAIVICSV